MRVNIEICKDEILEVGDIVKLSSGITLVIKDWVDGGFKYGLKYLNGEGMANGLFDSIEELLNSPTMNSRYVSIFRKNKYELLLREIK